MNNWNWLVEAIENNKLTDKLIREKASKLQILFEEMKTIVNVYVKRINQNKDERKN